MSSPSCQLAVKVVPNASRTEIVGWVGDALKIRVHAPPTDGKANAGLLAFLAETFDLPRHSVRIVSGHSGRQKRIQLDGIGIADIRARHPHSN